MKQLSKPVRIILILVFLGIAALSLGYVFHWARQSQQNNATQQQIEELYQQGMFMNLEPAFPSSPPSDSQSEEEQQVLQPPQPVMLPECAVLRKENKDVIGWLNLGNELLSTPILQRDNEYYLTHDFYHKESKHGQVFMDERNSIDFTNDNTILYGHNIPSDHSMFYVLTNYKKTEFVAEHPVIEVSSLYRKYQYTVAGVYLASTKPEHGADFDYINYLNFSSKTSKEQYFEQIKSRSLIDTGVDLQLDDKLLTLSTCSYEFDGARLVVVARKLRKGEKADDFGKNVTLRENPKMPQIWNELYGK